MKTVWLVDYDDGGGFSVIAICETRELAVREAETEIAVGFCSSVWRRLTDDNGNPLDLWTSDQEERMMVSCREVVTE